MAVVLVSNGGGGAGAGAAAASLPCVGNGFLHLERELEVGVDGLHLGDPGGDGGFARHAYSGEEKRDEGGSVFL